jgi:hypothetical protein
VPFIRTILSLNETCYAPTFYKPNGAKLFLNNELKLWKVCKHSGFKIPKTSENVITHKIIFSCFVYVQSILRLCGGGKLFCYLFAVFRPLSSQNSSSKRPIFTYLGLLERPWPVDGFSRNLTTDQNYGLDKMQKS